MTTPMRKPTARPRRTAGWRSAYSTSAVAQASHQDAVRALGLEVGEHHGQRLADYAPAVDGEPVDRAQVETRVLESDQLFRRDVDGDLLVVLLPPGRSAGGATLGS